MLGKRPDGRRVLGVEPFDRVIPYVMDKRSGAQNMFHGSLPCEGMAAYIAKKKQEGIELNYMHSILAASIRTIAERPKLNRFIINGQIYARHKIWLSFTIKRTLRGDATETTVKIPFEGTETLQQIGDTIDAEIQKVLCGEVTETDQVAKFLMSAPRLLIRTLIETLRFMDRHNCMPKAVLDASPWHTSLFFTNLKSLGLDYIYHHLTDFGTNGMFFAMGKEKMKVYCTQQGEIQAKKVVPFSLVMDERICDGLYFARAIRLLTKYVKNP